jgi:hypothetical protein
MPQSSRLTTSCLTNQSLRDAADRLLEERPDLAPGSVLRCFSRSVRAALLSGCQPAAVVAEAERITREVLAQRVPGPRVPRQRRAA